jgi:FkbM family methyltransferase
LHKHAVADYNHGFIGSNRWWLKETKGATLFDKSILNFLKVIYLGLRVFLKLALGKERRDRIYAQKDINFKAFLYKSIQLFRLDNIVLLEIHVTKYDYKVCCRLNKEDVVASTIHEEDMIMEHFTPKQGDVVVDLGANIGRYAVIASKRIGQNGKVVAIEAHPENFQILKKNIKLNRLANVVPLNYAVSSKETKIKLYTPDEELGYTMHHSIMFEYLSPRFKMKTEGKYREVNANTLDNLLQQNGIEQGQVNWIKIDVEGAEFEVLKGAHNVLSKSKDIVLIIEVHGSANNNNYNSIIELLNLYNFKIEFEKTYEGGEVHKHVIVRKLDPIV